MEKISIVILAAGRGTRMGQDIPKVTVKTREKPLLEHVLLTSAALKPERIVVVTGYKRELVEEVVTATSKKLNMPELEISLAVQKEQKGTGDAVKAALPALEGFTGTVVILYGDTPLVKTTTLTSMLEHHHANKATLTMLALKSESDTAYGRVVRGKNGQIEKIVEVKDCTPAQRAISEHNSGVYAVDSAFLTPAVSELKNENAQKEFYLTDIVERAVTEGQRVEAVVTYESDQVQGVNTPLDLAIVNRALERAQIEKLMASGISIVDPTSFFLDADVTVAAGTKIGPNVQLRTGTRVGANVVIEGSAMILNSKIGDNSLIKFSVRIEDSDLGSSVAIGPFANLRPGTVLEEEVKIGNFVETKKALLHRDVKASHLTYLGDCEIGEHTNIGAGTITCNFDGEKKSYTSIGKNVFVGSDSCLVAPLTIEDNAFIGAGSVITKKVEKGSLALTRAQQISKAGWADRKLRKKS